mgnify:CR=1 FL=1
MVRAISFPSDEMSLTSNEPSCSISGPFNTLLKASGKQFTKNQVSKVQKQREIIDKEATFNPRENRIINKNRVPFHYVGSMSDMRNANLAGFA